LGVVVFFIGLSFAVETMVRRDVRNAPEAESRNREIARLHGLDLEQPS
jgi:hypothetical protein